MADRRQVLQAGVLMASATLGGTACSEQSPIFTPTPSAPDTQQSDELALIAAYDAAIADARGATRAEYRRIREEHVEHLRALGWSEPPPAVAATARIPTRRQLRAAEKLAVRMRSAAALDAPDTDLAQTLALTAASEAQHVVRLEAL